MLTWVEINKKALIHNIKAFRTLIGKKTLLMPVIKSNAYGHGIIEIGKICNKNKLIDRLCVAGLDEALMLRKSGVHKTIHILSFFEFDEKKIIYAIKNNIIFPLYTLEQATYLNKIGERCKQKCIVHLKIDTGTNRVGVKIDELPNFAAQLKKLSFIDTEGIWSHFSSSEENERATKDQYQTLLRAEKLINTFKIFPTLKHLACSAASILYPYARLDAIRLGLSLYGLYPASKAKNKIDLIPVLNWKTKIIQVKKVKKGSKISYGQTYTMFHEGKIAVLPVGYFDGYDRAWSNKAEVVIQGKRCPVRGRICMNLMMVEVTKLKKCKVGEVVTLLGKDITADHLANLTSNTINYEITTHINPLLKRKLI